MGRTKQTGRKEPSSNARAKYQTRHFYQRGGGEEEEDESDVRCKECGLSMASFTRGSGKNWHFNGHTCPPCTRELQHADNVMRQNMDSGFGLFVPDHSLRGLVWIETRDPEFAAIATAQMGPIEELRVKRHSAHALHGTTPLYTMKTMTKWDENDEEVQMVPNNRAERIAMQMDIFDLDADNPILGPVLFLGPSDMPLTQEEIERFGIAANKINAP